MLTSLLLCTSVVPAQSAEHTSACHEELSSIDVSDGGWSAVDGNRYRFKHVFQSKEEYPYFEYIGGAMLGVESSRWFPNGIIPNFDYWMNLDGRAGGAADKHYSIIDKFYGRGHTHGVSVSFSSSEDYAFLFFDHGSEDIRESLDEGALIRQGFNEPVWGVLTFVNETAEFIGVDRRYVNLSCGSSRGYVYVGSRRLAFTGNHDGFTHCAAHADFESQYGHKYLRSIDVLAKPLRIAGVDRTQRTICRRRGIPLAVTNSDDLKPVLERELSAWADRVHASAIQYTRAEQEEEREKQQKRWVKIADFSRKSRGNFRRSGKNDVRIDVRNLRESNVVSSVWADCHLIVNGVDLGKLTSTRVGHIKGLLHRKRKRAEVRRKFEAGDFPTVHWSNTSTVYKRDDNRYVDCNKRTCSIYVRANKLEEAGWEF